MKQIRLLFCLLGLVALAAIQAPVWAQQTPAPTASPAPAATPLPDAPAKPPLTVLTPIPLAPIATQLGQTLQTLVGVPSSQPAPAAPVNGTAPAAAPDMSEDNVGQITDTFATDILDTFAQEIALLKADSAAFANNISGLPDLAEWLRHQGSDPRRQALWSAIGSDLLIIVGVPLLGSIAIGLMLLPLRLRLRREQPESLGGRIGVLFGLLCLRIIPAIVFLGASLLLLDQNETHKLPRFVILNVIYAITLGFTVRQILRGLFAPTTDHLRLFSFTTPQALYAYRWFSGFALIIVCGYFFVEVATAVRMPISAIVVFQNIFGLILTMMAIIVIVQTRMRVALILRGAKTETPTNAARALRIWLALHWHSLAITYLIISLTVTILGVDNGIALMLRGTILTFIILVVARLSFLALDRWATPTTNNSALMHRQILSFLLRPFIWVVAVAAIAATWGFHVNSFIATPSGQRAFGAFLSIALTLFILTVIYEMLNSSIERHLGQRDKDSKQPVASARARTLLPMVRNSIFILFSGVAILTFLSAVGFNIGPLLAGAGVIGVAIGFGSQSLVKDFLTGLFIVVENTVAVGDVVKIGDFGGVVEALSIRTIRLRDSDGSLHILPFSEVSKVSNMTRGFGYALVDVGVAYDSDMDHVMKVLREIGAETQEDTIFKRVILDAAEVTLEKLGDSAITTRIRIRTRPGKQWDVRRLLMQKILKRFAAENIEIAYPTVTSLTKMIGDAPSAKAQE